MQVQESRSTMHVTLLLWRQLYCLTFSFFLLSFYLTSHYIQLHYHQYFTLVWDIEFIRVLFLYLLDIKGIINITIEFFCRFSTLRMDS